MIKFQLHWIIRHHSSQETFHLQTLKATIIFGLIIFINILIILLSGCCSDYRLYRHNSTSTGVNLSLNPDGTYNPPEFLRTKELKFSYWLNSQ